MLHPRRNFPFSSLRGTSRTSGAFLRLRVFASCQSQRRHLEGSADLKRHGLQGIVSGVHRPDRIYRADHARIRIAEARASAGGNHLRRRPPLSCQRRRHRPRQSSRAGGQRARRRAADDSESAEKENRSRHHAARRRHSGRPRERPNAARRRRASRGAVRQRHGGHGHGAARRLVTGHYAARRRLGSQRLFEARTPRPRLRAGQPGAGLRACSRETQQTLRSGSRR